jgi:hypothetical protein
MHPTTTTVFCLSSGRSGTHFLYELIRRNASDCVARHEPYGANPSMFGLPIYEHAIGQRLSTRRLLERKRRMIESGGASTYVETSHAFLKSWFDLAVEYFPRLKFVHLAREPIKVAKSEGYREELLDWLHLPLRNYRGSDGKKYFRWALTGLEPIFRHFDGAKLTRLQWYIVQWFEIENRAMRFLDQFGKHADCFTLHSPGELNNQTRVDELFDFLGLKRRSSTLSIAGSQNKNWRRTNFTDDDRRQFDEVVQRMPANYLDIFRHQPYTRFPWAGTLQRLAGDAP